MNKVCPMKANLPIGESTLTLPSRYCEEEHCAWWAGVATPSAECVLMRIAKELGDIAGSLAMLIKK